MFPPECTKTGTYYRLPTTAGQKQPYSGSASGTASGAFLPMDRRDHALEGLDIVEPFEWYVPPATDIRPSDKVVIEAVTYMVKRVVPFTVGALSHKRVTLSREA